MRPIQKLLDMPIVTVHEGTRLGTLRGVEVAMDEGRILYLRVNQQDSRTDGVISWESVHSVGSDVIMVDSAGSLRETLPAADADRVTQLVGDRPVVTESGSRLGTVSSYDVDEQTGRIEQYRVSAGGLLASLTHSTITFPHTAIRTFGRDAMVVSDAVAPEKATQETTPGHAPTEGGVTAH